MLGRKYFCFFNRISLFTDFIEIFQREKREINKLW